MNTNPNTLLSAILAWGTAICGGAVTLIVNAGDKGFDGIAGATWAVLVLATMGNFFSSLHTLSTRAALRKVTGKPLAPSKYYPTKEEDEHEPTV